MSHRSHGWAVVVTTPPNRTDKRSRWLAGRFCFGHEEVPRHLQAYRIACWKTRREARVAAKAWRGPVGETAAAVRVTISLEVA